MTLLFNESAERAYDALKRERDELKATVERTRQAIGVVSIDELPLDDAAKTLREERDAVVRREQQTIEGCYARHKELAEQLERARETISRLNRRCQVAEAAVLEKAKTIEPGDYGRALANAAASINHGRVVQLEQALRDLRSYLAHAGKDARREFMAEQIGRALEEPRGRRFLDDFDPLTDEQLRRLRSGEPPSLMGMDYAEVITRLISMVDRTGMHARLRPVRDTVTGEEITP